MFVRNSRDIERESLSANPRRTTISTNLRLYMYVALLFGICSCMPDKMVWPEAHLLRGNFAQGKAAKRVTFQNYLHSEEVCRDLYTPWWKWYVYRRFLQLDQISRIIPPALLRALPSTPMYSHLSAPVQSISAKMGSRTANGESKFLRAMCHFACEDVRSDIEIWITFLLTNVQQTRYKAPFSMRCPREFEAHLIYRNDHREPRTDQLIAIDEQIMRSSASKYRGPESFPTPRDHLIDGKTVKCVCRPEFWRKGDPDPFAEVNDSGEDAITNQFLPTTLDTVMIEVEAAKARMAARAAALQAESSSHAVLEAQEQPEQPVAHIREGETSTWGTHSFQELMQDRVRTDHQPIYHDGDDLAEAMELWQISTGKDSPSRIPLPSAQDFAIADSMICEDVNFDAPESDEDDVKDFLDLWLVMSP